MQTAEVVAMGEAVKFIESIGFKTILDHENQVLNYALEKLKK